MPAVVPTGQNHFGCVQPNPMGPCLQRQVTGVALARLRRLSGFFAWLCTCFAKQLCKAPAIPSLNLFLCAVICAG